MARIATLWGGPRHGDTHEVVGTHLGPYGYIPVGGGRVRLWRGSYYWKITEPDGEIVGIWTSTWDR